MTPSKNHRSMQPIFAPLRGFGQLPSRSVPSGIRRSMLLFPRLPAGRSIKKLLRKAETPHSSKTSLFHLGAQIPGALAAHEAVRLPLLPSGPDGVHETPLRKTKALRSELEKTALHKSSVETPIASSDCSIDRRKPSTEKAVRKIPRKIASLIVASFCQTLVAYAAAAYISFAVL